MCGIAGLISSSGVDEGAVARMLRPIVHRGPDDEGIWLDPEAGVGLGHRRLSILDLSPAGRQPMRSSNGRYVLTFNGEIYNHPELRAALEADGAVPEGGWRGHSDTELFVEGIATYHLVVEGFLAVTGQTLIRDYMMEHGLYPGFCEGFGLVERDEHRHVAFGVRVLKDAIAVDPAYRDTIERTVLRLVPPAAHVFVPPYVEDPSEFVSYGYTSREIYGLAYRTLKRRMKILGIEIPPASELMPGPIAEPTAVVSANGGG